MNKAIELKAEHKGWDITYVEKYDIGKFIAVKGDDETEADNLKELIQKVRRYEKKKIDAIYNGEKVICHFVVGERQLWVTNKKSSNRSRQYASNIYLDNEENKKHLQEMDRLNEEETKMRKEKNDLEEKHYEVIGKIDEKMVKKDFYEKKRELEKKMIAVNFEEKVIDKL
jgi:hypothetical protein|tara:strand:- start:2089 stop:2598 length:510 start_codon:yes stop_codon:yes gene_type:complete